MIPVLIIYRKENCSIGYAFEHRFNNILSVKQNFRYLNNDAYIRGVFADDGLTGRWYGVEPLCVFQ